MDEHELRRMMYTAQMPGKGSFVIRLPRGNGVLVDWKCPLEEIEVGKGRKLHDGNDVAVLSVGPLGNDVADIIKEHEASDAAVKVSIAHYDMRFVKPLDEAILHEVGKKFKRIVTVEDGARNGGFGSAVLEWMSDNGYMPSIKRLGLPDQFIEHGTVPELREIAGIDKESIRKSVINT